MPHQRSTRVSHITWPSVCRRLLHYRPIKSIQDQILLQQDLKQLDKWANTWGMKFNAKTCYLLSCVKNSFPYFYSLNKQILQSVTKNPYLGLTMSEDLKLSTHINNICSKDSSTLGLLRRNLRLCSLTCRKNAYISLVWSTLEYGAIIWPRVNKQIENEEQAQDQIDKLQ